MSLRIPRPRFGRRERGATIVIVSISMVALLGMSAVTIDFAMASAKKEQLQGAADAAAIAIGKACAKSVTACQSNAKATADWYALKAGGTAGTPTINSTSRRVTVAMSAQTGSGLGAAVFDDDAIKASTDATAEWTIGTVSAVTDLALPLGFEYCAWKRDQTAGGERAYDFKLVPLPVSGTNKAQEMGCSDPVQPEGAAPVYNLHGPHDNQATIFTAKAFGWSSSDCGLPTGEKLSVWRNLAENFVAVAFTLPTACDAKFKTLTGGSTYLVPIYVSYKSLDGKWGSAKIVGFAPFKLKSSKPFRTSYIFTTAAVDKCDLGFTALFGLIQAGCYQVTGSWVKTATLYSSAEYAAAVAGIPLTVNSASGPPKAKIVD